MFHILLEVDADRKVLELGTANLITFYKPSTSLFQLTVHDVALWNLVPPSYTQDSPSICNLNFAFTESAGPPKMEEHI